MSSYSRKVSGSEVSSTLVLIMEMLGLGRLTRENQRQGLRVDLKISGQAKQLRNPNVKFPIKDEIIRFQTISYSNYKSIYMGVSENVKNLMYPDILVRMKEMQSKGDIEILSQNEAFWYIDQGWRRTACHDSCWREGFSLSQFEIDDISIVSVTLQEAIVENKFYDNSDLVASLLNGDAKTLTEIACPIVDKGIIELINSIVYDCLHHSHDERGFRVTLLRFNEKKQKSTRKELLLCKNNCSKTSIARAYSFNPQKFAVVGDFNEELLQYLLPDGDINQFSVCYLSAALMLDREVSAALDCDKNYNVIAYNGKQNNQNL